MRDGRGKRAQQATALGCPILQLILHEHVIIDVKRFYYLELRHE
jgi:hypothetical protein